MLTQLKKLIRLNLDDVALCCGVVGGVFLLTQLIIGGVMIFTKPDSSVMISQILLPIAAGIMIFIVALSHTILSFVQALQFGQTRRRALGLTLGVVGFQGLCAMVLAALLAGAERWLAPGLWRVLSGSQLVTVGEIMPTPVGLPVDPLRGATLVVEPFSMPWWLLPLIALGALVLGLIVGAVFQRFGAKGGWAMWAIWMVACFSPQLLQNVVLVDDFVRWLVVVGAVTVLGGLTWSVWSLLHAVVKS